MPENINLAEATIAAAEAGQDAKIYTPPIAVNLGDVALNTLSTDEDGGPEQGAEDWYPDSNLEVKLENMKMPTDIFQPAMKGYVRHQVERQRFIYFR